MNKITLIIIALQFINIVKAQENTRINWTDKSEKVLVQYKSEKNETLIFLYYVDNDSVKMVAFSDVYVSESIRKMGAWQLDSLLNTDLKLIEQYKSCIVMYKSAFLISIFDIKLMKPETPEILVNIHFEDFYLLNNVITKLARNIFFSGTTYSFNSVERY